MKYVSKFEVHTSLTQDFYYWKLILGNNHISAQRLSKYSWLGYSEKIKNENHQNA